MKLIIHGGFFSESDTSDEVKQLKQKALARIVQQGYDYLGHHNAYETVIYTVALLEDDPLFNAGFGSQLQSDGAVRMSAAIMDGQSQKMSGVINIQEVENPVRVAEALMKEEDRIIGGNEATRWAREKGFEPFSPITEERQKEYELRLSSSGTGTVGCVALDKDGHLAVATSTGGKGFEIPGRISDSATVAGNYANNHCGVSCTGVGEDIVSGAVAVKIVTRVTDGMALGEAVERSLVEMKPYDGFCGVISMDAEGAIYHQNTHPTMVYASFDGAHLEVFQ